MSAGRRATPRGRLTWHRVVLTVAAAALLTPTLTTSASAARPHPVWVAAWSGSPQGQIPVFLPEGNQGAAALLPARITIRNIIHPSIAGSMVRVRVTNLFGNAPLRIEAVTVGVSGQAGGVVPNTLRIATFHRRFAVTLPIGADALSDPVPLGVDPSEDLAVSIAVPAGTTVATGNLDPQQFNYMAAGDNTTQLSGAGFDPNLAWSFLSSVDVLRAPPAHSVVVLGDSITSGFNSAVDANARWPDYLARRLDARPGNGVSVVNAGIAGNELLNDDMGPSAVARLHRDVLEQTGVRTVIVLEGVNDLNTGSVTDPVSAGALIAADQQIITAAHHAGVRVLGATLLPFGGSFEWTPAKEAQREAFNSWIRTGGAFDGTIDFATPLADPKNPQRLLPSFDSGDHLHPNDVGYAALAAVVPLDDL